MSTKEHFAGKAGMAGENFEKRQTATSEDFKPDPSKSLKLSPARQALIDDIIALYSCEPTIRRVERYTPDCVVGHPHWEHFVHRKTLHINCILVR